MRCGQVGGIEYRVALFDEDISGLRATLRRFGFGATERSDVPTLLSQLVAFALNPDYQRYFLENPTSESSETGSSGIRKP